MGQGRDEQDEARELAGVHVVMVQACAELEPAALQRWARWVSRLAAALLWLARLWQSRTAPARENRGG
jgi:protein-S-isoprenylcysteine O-methyltransferase Ste14